jgi:hypothetical protein
MAPATPGIARSATTRIEIRPMRTVPPRAVEIDALENGRRRGSATNS